jgi:type I restriction enzyme S subunit
MNPAQLLEHFDRIAEAPDAVPRLRRFILDLAVRGKLVEQDPKDEPASELLKRIAAEKARLVKEGEIRKLRDASDGHEVAQPFHVPPSWRWCRLDAVGAIIGGGTPPAGDLENFAPPGEGIPWLTPADLGGYTGLHIGRGSRDLSEKGLKTSSATVLPAGSVLFTSRAPIGYVAIAANPISTNQGFKSVIPYIEACSRFIALGMKTFAPEIDARAPGTTFK